MKILCVDNFDRDYLEDSLVCENVSEFYGKKIVDALNKNELETSPYYYKLVNDDYKLKKIEP